MYNLSNIPSKTVYKKVLEMGLRQCTQAIFIARKNYKLDESALALIKEINPYLIHKTENSKWPGTTLLKGTAVVYYFRYIETVCQLLNSKANTFFDWVHPKLPEDLCLIRENGAPWFVTISHETDCYFDINENEAILIENDIPEIGKLIKQTNVNRLSP